ACDLCCCTDDTASGAMFPEPRSGSYDWARAGEAITVASTRAAMVFMTRLLLRADEVWLRGFRLRAFRPPSCVGICTQQAQTITRHSRNELCRFSEEWPLAVRDCASRTGLDRGVRSRTCEATLEAGGRHASECATLGGIPKMLK